VSVGVVIAILISGLFTGALARLAVPGPDPMPLWLTVAIGLTGSIVGAVVARTVFNGNGYVVSFGSLFVAIALVIAYRRYVQHRPVWGPEAMRFPQRGLGVGQYRERLGKLGIDPDRLNAPPASPDESTRLLAMLDELHRAGVIDDDELQAKRARVLDRDESPT
jgi:uncharacterized membrane protein YeaQ/YmgE (transglycosylase-associated protein family)